MKKNKLTLNLNRETLRTLDSESTAQIQGGALRITHFVCTSSLGVTCGDC